MSPIFSEAFARPQDLPFGVISAQPLLSGDAGVEQTIQQMRQLVDDAVRDPSIIRLAKDIVRGTSAFDDPAEVEAIYNWVRNNIRFTKDPVNKEALYPPAELLKIRSGDCDDIAMLLASLVMAVGYPARLMTVAASPGSPEQFSHVYVEAEVPPGSNQWIPVDPARYDSQFGLAPAQFTRARWWSLSDNSYGDLSGTKVYNHGGTVNVHLSGYPRFRSHLGATRRHHVSGLGQPAAPDPTAQNIATIEQGTASIIRATQGQPASPYDYAAAGPWSSFQTAYSPYGPAAGYTSPLLPNVSLTSTSNIGLWLILGIGALFLFGRRY